VERALEKRIIYASLLKRMTYHQLLQLVFSPFVTTRPDRIAGRGLAWAREAVQMCAGTIEMHSKWSSGATVLIILPAASSPTSNVQRPTPYGNSSSPSTQVPARLMTPLRLDNALQPPVRQH